MNQMPDRQTLETLVRDTGQKVLMPFFGHTTRAWKADRSIVTEADVTTQKALQQALQQRWPELAFLGEEMDADEQYRLMQEHIDGIWTVDPLDGTSNFAAGIPYFAISVALIVDAKVALSVVYDPNRDELFSFEAGAGSRLNGEPLQLPEDCGLPISRTIGVIDFKRLDAEMRQRLINTPPYSSQRSFGSVALDWCWLAAGRYHLYLHGRSHLWDYAAGLHIFTGAGGQSCSFDGQPVFNGRIEARSIIAACDHQLFRQWCDYLDVAAA